MPLTTQPPGFKYTRDPIHKEGIEVAKQSKASVKKT